MAESTKSIRDLWKRYECQESELETIPFGPDRIRVAPPTADAWDALAAVLQFHDYEIRTSDTDSYNCRNIKGSEEKSLHAFGVALDINWTTNPFRDHSGVRKPRFSRASTQVERAEDVRHGSADTDMTEAMIADVLAIKTKSGKGVFEWGGNWKSVKDCMHFEIDVSPEDLATGIDLATVKGWDAFVARAEAETPPDPQLEPVQPNPTPPNSLSVEPRMEPTRDLHRVIARSGLRLRNDASDQAEILGLLPPGKIVNVVRRVGNWAQVDLEGDGLADGFASLGFLEPVLQVPGTVGGDTAPPTGGMALAALGGGRDVTADVTVDQVARMFPNTGRRHIQANLPHVLAGLRNRGIPDRDMVLMALATIRAETEGFEPISEFRSRFNTRNTPFDLYDAGTRIGRVLGNTQPGDGPRFRGRGYIQLTGRSNYTSIGAQLGLSLTSNPELANDPQTAGLILAQFLVNKARSIRASLGQGDLRTARKRVNGGSHGLDRFSDAFRIGSQVLPT